MKAPTCCSLSRACRLQNFFLRPEVNNFSNIFGQTGRLKVEVTGSNRVAGARGLLVVQRLQRRQRRRRLGHVHARVVGVARVEAEVLPGDGLLLDHRSWKSYVVNFLSSSWQCNIFFRPSVASPPKFISYTSVLTSSNLEW